MTSTTDAPIDPVTSPSEPTGEPADQIADPIALEGSSPPGGGAPTFQPTASSSDEKRFGLHSLRRPMMRSGKQRLAELVDEYERAIDFWNATAIFENEAGESVEGRDQSDIASAHASRILAELERMIQAIPAMDLHDLGLKARVVSWSDRSLWSEDREPGLCALLDNVLLVAGMDRIRATDFAFGELLPGYTGPDRYAAPANASEPRTEPSRGPMTELRRLAAAYREAIALHNEADATRGTERTSEHAVAQDRHKRRIAAIEERATQVRAQDAEDALFQLLLTAANVDALESWVGEPSDGQAALVVPPLRQSRDRCLYSIRDVLERLAGVTGADVNGGYGMSADEDPFVLTTTWSTPTSSPAVAAADPVFAAIAAHREAYAADDFHFPKDPIPALLAERREAIARVNEGCYGAEAEADALMDRWGACDAAVMTQPATTLAGARASLEWARDELLLFGFDGEEPDKGTRLVLSLLDGALGVLRNEGGDRNETASSQEAA